MMLVILSILFIYFLLFHFILALTTNASGLQLFIESLSATLSTVLVTLFMTIPLFLTVFIGNYFFDSFIPILSFELLLKIFFCYSSLLFLYELTFERVFIRFAKMYLGKYGSLFILLMQFFIGLFTLTITIFYIFSISTWTMYSIIILVAIDSYLNYLFDVLTDEEKT